MTDLFPETTPLTPASAAPHPTNAPQPDQLEPPRVNSPRPRLTTTGQPNRLTQFRPAILAVRWATTCVSIALAGPALLNGDVELAAWLGLVLANTGFRTIRPLADNGSTRHLIVLLAEIAVNVLAVVATGFWDSPLVLVLINAVIIAGFARGFGFAIRVGAASTLAVATPGLGAPDWGAEQVTQSAQWATLLLLGAIVAGYARRISGEASLQHDIALDRVSRLADANALLTDLHRVAQTLPASLDQADVLDSTLARLRSLIDYEVVAILLADDHHDRLKVARQTAAGLGPDVLRRRLPVPAQQALSFRRLVSAPELGPDDRPLNTRSKAGLYIPLLARGRLIGLLAVETQSPHGYTQRDERVMQGFVEPMALAVDNARLFDRIRTVGADEERTRIARDLHDRVGQSLAYLGIEIDRLIRRTVSGQPIEEQLRTLREDLRLAVVEVRDTLSDLRTDVTDSKDFATTAHAFAFRLAERSGLALDLDCETDQRLPILQEREMWRIAQEALVNVERHAQATEVKLTWTWSHDGALLEVIDNGCGLPPTNELGQVGRSDSYGILGMRERANSVGAAFELISKPGEGTKIRCFLASR